MMSITTFQSQHDSISGDSSLLSADSLPMQYTLAGESEWCETIVGGRHLPFVQGCELTRAT